MWYNNDSSTVFPAVLVASGGPDDPVALAEADLIAEAVVGMSSGWSSFEFSEPVASRHGGFYVLFRFPVGSEQVAEGFGGGAGIGFVDDGGYPGWMTADGSDWVKVGRSYGFAVEPQYVSRQMGMLEKSMAPVGPGDDADVMPEVFETALLPAVPNPFNPSTDIRFALKDASRVEIRIFDVRGRRVIDLVNEEYPAGEHAVTWTGRDNTGQRVASGVYLVQFGSDGIRANRSIKRIMDHGIISRPVLLHTPRPGAGDRPHNQATEQSRNDSPHDIPMPG